MSSSNRTASKGGSRGSKATDKSHKSSDNKSEGGKSGDRHVKGDPHTRHEADVKEKVKTLIEMSQRPEDEVCLALHECDNDLNQAMNMLLENEGHGEWEMRVKKKKNRQVSTSKQEKGEEAQNTDDWQEGVEGSGVPGDKTDAKGRKQGPGRPYGRHNDSRGWRGREKQENERNADERKGPRTTRGPGAGGRGRGGGRTGGRYPPRNRTNSSYNNKPIETWDNNTANQANHSGQTENWDDFPGTDEWSTEEYTGSLADTKVFTPSVATNAETIDNSQGLSIDNAVINTGQMAQGMPLPPTQSPVQIAGTLNAAQTQYLNQLTQQNSDNIKQYGSAQAYHAQNSNQYPPPAAGQQHYPNNYAATAGYQEQQPQQPAQQPARTKTQRARVPPPSKIPSSAVEMPGDINSSIGYLDVQFGAMDFMSEASSFDGVSEAKYSTGTGGLDNAVTSSGGNIDLSAASQNSTLDAYSPKSNTQSSISSALSQSLTNNESIPQTSEHLTSGYSTGPRNSTTGSTVTPSATPSGLELSKQADAHGYSQQSYNSYQNKGTTYVTTYSGTQTSNTYASNQANSNNYTASQNAAYNTATGAAGTTGYQNYSTPVTYQVSGNSAAGFPSITQPSSYPSNNQSYQQNSNQSVYGSGTGTNAASSYGSTAAGSQYNNYASSNHNKMTKDGAYETSGSGSTQTTSSTTTSQNNSTTSTKATCSALSKTTNSVVSNMPPGVAPPVMSTPYIMGQMPYFQQPVYSYEEMQLLQQRLPHMTTPYYDMSYQTPTTLAAVRDGSLGNVGYSMSSDGRFTRADNNASPVPTTLSQQTSTLTQGHQAPPILAGTTHPYFFTAALNTFPNYQFGAAMYTQVPAATNAHGTSNSTQYPKQANYASAYSSYDTLSQAQDYNKTGYVGNNQGQKGGGVNATSTGSTGSDLSMYGKSHAALGKVNSYDKQGFHSGTPPPFTGALHGGQNAALAPSGTGYGPQVYIPALAPHQQPMSTQLMHQPLHQIDMRHQGRRMDSANSSGQRSQSTNATKGGAKQGYQTSYWNPA